MEEESSGTEPTEPTPMQETAPAKSTSQPPIVLTSAANLIQLQKQMKGVAKQSFELPNARNGTRVFTKDTKYFQAVKAHFDQNNLCYFTFFPKSEKPLKAVIRHLPSNTPAEDIAEALLGLGFDFISVKQMTTTRRSTPEETNSLLMSLTTIPNHPTQDP
jgi:hypothetical protein